MQRRLFLATIFSASAVCPALGFFDGDHEEHGNGQGSEHGHAHRDDASRHEGGVRYFRPEDRALLSRYYPMQTLPPGLRKKYARTGTLPRNRPLDTVLRFSGSSANGYGRPICDDRTFTTTVRIRY